MLDRADPVILDSRRQNKAHENLTKPNIGMGDQGKVHACYKKLTFEGES
jgi:hypothetical protein